MSNIKITCDSTCDLTRNLYEKYDIHVIPMGISLGDDFRYDGENITAEEIYSYVEKTGNLPTTSAISVGEYLEHFGRFTEGGYQVIHINLSSELSSSHQNACIAAQSLGNVYVVDSRSLSTGSGHLALMARELSLAGCTADEIVAALNDVKQRLDVSFVLQTLEYLHKGGRCSGIAVLGANMLKLRPEIEVTNGKMTVGKKYRGNMEKSILSYVRGRLEGVSNVDYARIFVTHSGVPGDIVEKVVTLVKELQPFEEVIVTNAGSTISSHCGPCCLGVLFLRTKD